MSVAKFERLVRTDSGLTPPVSMSTRGSQALSEFVNPQGATDLLACGVASPEQTAANIIARRFLPDQQGAQEWFTPSMQIDETIAVGADPGHWTARRR